QLRVRLRVGVLQVLEDPTTRLEPRVTRDLREPDRRLDRLDLAEERSDLVKGVAPPVLEQSGSFRGNAPRRLRQLAPRVHLLPYFVDERRGVVRLLVRRQPLPFVEDQPRLLRPALTLLRLRDCSDVP